MKIQVQQQDLLKGINIAQKAISQRTTIQILSGILFEAKGTTLKLTATDLELSVETTIECIVEQEGAVVINSAIIGNIIRKLPNNVVQISVTGERMDLNCMNSKFQLIGTNPAEYPALPTVSGEPVFQLQQHQLIETIRQTAFSVSEDETRIALTGIFVEKKNKQLNFVALDGYRLAKKSFETEDGEEVEVIVPGRTMKELSRILEDTVDPVAVYTIPGHILFKIENTLLYSRLIEKKYIDYREILSDDSTSVVRSNTAELLSALERASLLASREKANLVKLHIERDKMTIYSNTEFGNAHEEVFIDNEGQVVDIAFNARYIIEGVRAIQTDEVILNFNGSLNPCILYPTEHKENYCYLLLPVRLAKEA